MTAAASASATMRSASAISARAAASAASAVASACWAMSTSRRATRPCSTSCCRVASVSRALATAPSRNGKRFTRLIRYSRAASASSEGIDAGVARRGAMASPTSTNAHAIRHRLIEGSYYSGCHLTSGRSGPQSGEVTQLVLPDDVVFTCQQSGACCRNDWLIGVEDSARARLEAVDWTRLSPPLPPGPKFRPLPFALPGGERATFARRPDGACVFLDPDERCGIHTRLGARGKPQVCREFPYSFVDTPDGVAVGVSFARTAVRAHHGHSLSAQQAEIREVLAGSTRVRRLPGPLALYSSVDITWAQYRPIEAALLA